MCGCRDTPESAIASAESLGLTGCLGHRHYFIGREWVLGQEFWQDNISTNTTCTHCFRSLHRSVTLKHLALVFKKRCIPSHRIWEPCVCACAFWVDLPSGQEPFWNRGQEKRRHGSLWKHSPDNQSHVSQASVALFSAGCQLLSGLEMCFLWATSTRWKDDSPPQPSPSLGSHRL